MDGVGMLAELREIEAMTNQGRDGRTVQGSVPRALIFHCTALYSLHTGEARET